jgi:hypothetical protein
MHTPISRATGLLAAAAMLWSSAPFACVEGVPRGEAVTHERQVGATAAGESANLNILGMGWLRAAEVVKRGGDSDNTFVTLELDGLEVMSTSFANLKNPWMQLATNYISASVRTEGDASVLTIWYAEELKFRGFVVLRVDVQEAGVETLRMRTVMNKPAPHEHLPGQTPTALALPAFK